MPARILHFGLTMILPSVLLYSVVGDQTSLFVESHVKESYNDALK